MFRNRPIALTLVLAAIVVMAFGTLARAQSSVAKGAAVTVHATITAIDATNRIIELKTDDGSYETVYAGPEVKRFAELKVGQKVTFSYYESVVLAIQKADDKTKPGEDMKVERSTGATPGGMLSHRVTTVVTVDEVKPSVPSITVTTEDGRKVSFKVEDARNLVGVKAGDKVKITYTQALAVSVK